MKDKPMQTRKFTFQYAYNKKLKVRIVLSTLEELHKHKHNEFRQLLTGKIKTNKIER
jgi:hypothetical protein